MNGQPNSVDSKTFTEPLDTEFALKAAGLGVWELNPVTRQLKWDDRCRALFGLTSDSQLSYEEAIQYIHPDDVSRVNQTVEQALDPLSGGSYDCTYRTVGADDGLLRWVRFIGQSYFTPEEAIYRFAGVAQNVTTETEAQRIKASEERFRAMVEQAPVAMALFSGPDFVITLANERVLDYWARKREQVMGKPLFEALPEASGQGFEELLTNVYTTGERFVARELTVNLERNGRLERTYIDFVYEPFYEADGTISGITVACIEITEQVEQRHSIEANKERLQFTIEAAELATWDLNPATNKFAGNDRLMEWFGLSAQTGIDLTMALDVVVAKDRQRVADAIQRAMDFSLGGKYNTEFTIVHPFTRVERVVRAIGQVVFGQDQTPQRFNGILQDITQEVTARDKLAASEVRFRSLIQEAAVATGLYVGQNMVIEVANEIMIGYWGKDASVIGKPLAEALPELQGQPFLQLLNDIRTTGKMHEEKAARADLVVNGVLNTYYFDYSYKPLRNTAGDIYAIMNMAIDVTEQVVAHRQLAESEERYRNLAADLERQVQLRTEELATTNETLAATNREYAIINDELAEANKLFTRSNENLEQFAYIASHDLQEPLRKVQQFGDLLSTQYGDQLGEGTIYLERMKAAASRMSTLIKDLLTFSRISSQQDDTTRVSLTQVVDTVLLDLELRIQETGAVVQVEPLPTVPGDESQLEQLFQNLLSNALKFRQPKVAAHIEVTCCVVADADLPASVKPARLARSYYRIDVADNGIGFDEKYVDRIFQVFQRLHGKSEFAGTGIGLAICGKVVTNHGGAITASSQPGQGAIFSIYIPQ